MAKKSTLSRRSSKVAKAKLAFAEATAEQRRILYIITKSVWGGAAKYVFDLSINLSNEFEISVAAGGKNKLYKKIKKAQIPYFNINNFQRNINPFKDFFAFFEVLGLLFQIKPDIIHVNSSKAGSIVGLAGWVYKLLSGKQICLIFTAHGWAFNEDRPKSQIKLIIFLSKLTALFYDKIICVSEYDQKTALRNKIAPDDKLTVIHNGIDIERISFLTKEKAQKKLIGKVSPFVIGTIAEYTNNKGLIYLLKAIKNIEDQDINVILIGSGENPDKEKLKSFIKKYNLKNIHLIEFIDNAASYLKAFDIFILPSIKEGLPYTILEAMSAEVPVIATDVGGIPEIIENNINGILIKPKNHKLIKEKILYLINNPEIAQKLAKNARQKVKKEFTLEKMIEETKNVYL
ncbi:glycosyltransferase family 4 protein [Patescibacteria group bacterium]|nr:glycosyltransferase family 4 protein [Patescibacteria group bacterium]